MKTYRKLDENTIEVTDTTPQVVVSTFILNDLTAKVDVLKKKKIKTNEDIDAEIAAAEEDLLRATSLGVEPLAAEPEI